MSITVRIIFKDIEYEGTLISEEATNAIKDIQAGRFDYRNLHKYDKSVVLEAVKQDGFALPFAKEKYRNDKSVILAAVNQNKYALKYVKSEYNDKALVAAANRGMQVKN